MINTYGVPTMANERTDVLEELARVLTGVVVNEADPRNWPGGLTPVQELSREEQGARVTCKKSAVLTVGLLTKVTDLLNATANPASPAAVVTAKAGEEAATVAQIREMEKEAKAIYERLGIGAKH